MRKTVLAPGFADSRADGVPHVVFADGVVTHHADHDRVLLSGAGAPGETVAEQVTELFLMLDTLLADIDGSIDDVVKTRYHVLAEHLSRETQADVDAVRAEFFEYPHYPASTMVGVADLLGDEMLVEVEIEVVIPREEQDGTDGEPADAPSIRDRREPLTAVLTREGESLTVEDARAREGLDDGGIEIEFETVEEADDQSSGDSNHESSVDSDHESSVDSDNGSD